MTVSPKKHVTSATASRGVEAKEVEIVNINLASRRVVPGGVSGGGRRASPPSPDSLRSPPSREDAASYIQVLVQKQRRGQERCPPLPRTPPRRPVAAVASPPSPEVSVKDKECSQSKRKVSLWHKVRDISEQDLEHFHFEGPERLDIYQFESGVWRLSSRGAAPTRLERAVRRRTRPAARLLREAAAALRLAGALPGALLAPALAAAMAAGRDAALGLLQALSDGALKPALVVCFNALMRPALVLLAQTVSALREALAPLWLAAGDAVVPAARLLAAVRLVQVDRRCGCGCECARAPSTV